MIINEDVYLEHFNSDLNDIYNFLAHHGVKGQKWGHRKAKMISGTKTFGRGTASTGKAIGRGTVSTAKFLNRHKKGTAAVAIGAGTVFAALILHKNLKMASLKVRPANSFERAKQGIKIAKLVNGFGRIKTKNIALPKDIKSRIKKGNAGGMTMDQAKKLHKIIREGGVM